MLILGVFNAKIGAAIKVIRAQLTSGERQVLKLANKEKMTKLNTVKEKFKGVYTSREEKSIIDCVLTDTASANLVKERKIDEEKQHRLHKLDENTASSENKKYT